MPAPESAVLLRDEDELHAGPAPRCGRASLPANSLTSSASLLPLILRRADAAG
jgi:hypothetical protein